MNKKGLILSLIISGMTLGTAWAVRGKFGHEQGAAWAGAIGALVILLLARKEGWYARFFKAVLASAIGWGLGGMMSYGKVVGYGRGVDFGNVFYGFLMLFVIGGLHGFLGGGLFGLTLTDTQKNRVNWPLMFTGMVAAGIATYFFVIMQLEWLMTPPRSEAWAVCLGMAFFLLWFLIRHQYTAATRVAFLAGLGGGFGFAFGNFLQVMGNVAEIQFSMWNVMEYSIGFFGGVGMAYGTFTSTWEETVPAQRKSSNLIPMLLIVLFIPFVVWDQSFTMEKLLKTYIEIFPENGSAIASIIQVIAISLIIVTAGFVWLKYYSLKKASEIRYSRAEVHSFFVILFALYIVFSFLRTGAYVKSGMLEHYLYLVNFFVIIVALPKLRPVFEPKGLQTLQWSRVFLLSVAILALLAYIAINTHEDMPGMQKRFDFFSGSK